MGELDPKPVWLFLVAHASSGWLFLHFSCPPEKEYHKAVKASLLFTHQPSFSNINKMRRFIKKEKGD